MSGYENSPDYGSGGRPPWLNWAALAIVVLAAAGLILLTR